MTRITVVGAAGLATAFLLALALGDSLAAAAEVVALAAGASLVVSVAGIAVMRRLDRRPLAVHLWIGVMTTVLGVAFGVIIASWRMFLSNADARAVLVILVAAGTVGIVTAIAMAARLDRAVRALGRMAASLGERPNRVEIAQPVPTRELAALASQLHYVAEQLHESILRERSLESSRRELVAWISHDLRTPLAGIQAVTEALEDGVVRDPETVMRYHQIVRTEVERLSGMVDDLFRLSRIHTGLIKLDLQAASLADLVSDALSLAAPVAAARSIRLTGQVPDHDLPVRLATTEFLRVLRNLLDNALRHTPDGGEVSLQAETSPVEAIVTVRDGCGGIPATHMARVFDVGYRGDAARSPGSGKRAGLGLAIAQGLVQAHGGHISVDNDAHGCCFTVRVPLSAVS